MKKLVFILLIVFLIVLSGCSSKRTVKFVTNGGGEVADKVLEKGEELELPTVTKEGYNFDGWYLDAEFTERYTNQEIKKDITLYAKWTIKTFTVRFVDYDNTILKEQTVEYGEDAQAPNNPTRTGYGFTGWDKEFTNVKQDLTVKAEYQINVYKVKFLDKEGNVLSEQNVNHGENANAPQAPDVVGFVFKEWNKAYTNITENVTIEPVYEVQKFNVIFKDHAGNKIGDTQVIEYGKSATAPDDPVRVGYDFEGWDKDFTNVTSNLEIRPRYTPIVYSITYYDGTQILNHEPKTYTIEDKITLQEYQKGNLGFVGWYKDNQFKEEVTEITKGTTGNLEFYGKWVTVYPLVYELNGGSWTWNIGNVTNPGNGIDSVSTLPEIFMADFYMYLKENNLLTSNKVDSSLHKTTWEAFKANYTDPVAIYNHTTSNTSQTNNGYSQLFFDTATGNPTTGEFITIEGGFLGTEPYKSKYMNLINHIAILTHAKYQSNYFYEGVSGKSLAGFVLDGYFYGTQDLGTGLFAEFRSAHPNTNVRYVIDGNKAKKVDVKYQPTEFIPGKEVILVSPFKDDHIFGGWYDNPQFTGNPITRIPADVTSVPEKLYAKWIAISSLQ